MSVVAANVFGVKSFVEEQREIASRWKESTTALPEAARDAAPYVNKAGVAEGPSYSFCLPAEHAQLNLLPDVRERALAIFAELGIPWHAGVDGGPSNHLLSSQVQCANALTAMVDDPERIVTAFGKFLDIEEVVEVESGRFLTFEYVGPDDYLGEAVGGARTRGANCTSVDAAFGFRNAGGQTELALVEWKYTESYRRVRKADPRKDEVRAGRYRSLYEAADGALEPVLPFALMLDEPFYQLMRQQLLAAELEKHGVADAVRVLHVLDPANIAYQQSIVRPEVRALGETVDEAWSRLVKDPSRFVHVDPEVFRDSAVTSAEYVARYAAS